MTGSDIMMQDSNLVMPVPEASARQKRDCSGRFLVAEILSRFDVTPRDLARYVGSSFLTVVRWARGDTSPGPTFTPRLAEALYRLEQGELLETGKVSSAHTFASRGARRRLNAMPLFQPEFQVELEPRPLPPMLSRLQAGGVWGDGAGVLASMLADHAEPASTADEPVVGGVSAGKNTYTYDAHTYHTKVPPQGIAEILRGYLPTGGIVLDPFAGSGMTGVAACALGLDVVLNELSPAASFIADRFTRFCDPDRFEAVVDAVRTEVAELRRRLYTTHCRECGEPVEILSPSGLTGCSVPSATTNSCCGIIAADTERRYEITRYSGNFHARCVVGTSGNPGFVARWPHRCVSAISVVPSVRLNTR